MYIAFVLLWSLCLFLVESNPTPQEQRNTTGIIGHSRTICDEVPTKYFDPAACMTIFKSMQSVYKPHQPVNWTGDGTGAWESVGCRLTVEFAGIERGEEEFSVSEVVRVSVIHTFLLNGPGIDSLPGLSTRWVENS